jgi:hypothetical protein
MPNSGPTTSWVVVSVALCQAGPEEKVPLVTYKDARVFKVFARSDDQNECRPRGK